MRSFLWFFFLPVALSAQPWVGPTAVSVEVSDAKGKPVVGAEVTLTYGGENGGPGVVTTDTKGRATVRGLTAGTWLIEIRHPAFMIYSADLAIEPGKAAKASNAALLKAGDSFDSFKVKFAKAEGAPRPSAPVPEAAPTPEPAPRPAPTPTPRQTTPPPVTRPAPTKVPAPTPAPPPKPTPIPAPVVTPPPVPPPRLRSHRDGSCPECQPGEWAIDVRGEPQADGAGCPTDVAARIAAALPTTAPGLAGQALALRDADSGAFRAEVAALAEIGGRCQALVAFVPTPAKFIGFQAQGRATQGPVPCSPDGSCPGGGKFYGPPTLKKTTTGTFVAVAFEAAADGSGVRQPELVVYFSQQGWQPPVR